MAESSIVVRPGEPVSLSSSLTERAVWSDAGQTLSIETGRVVIAAANAAAMDLRVKPIEGEWLEITGWGLEGLTVGGSESFTVQMLNADDKFVDEFAAEALVNGDTHGSGALEANRSTLPILLPAGFALRWVSSPLTANDNIEMGMQGIPHRSSI